MGGCVTRSEAANLGFLVGRWMWLAVTVALIAIGGYLFVQVSQFDDSAELSAEVAELRGFQERMTTAGLRESIGLMPSGTVEKIFAEVEEHAATLPLDPDRHAEAIESVDRYVADLRELFDQNERLLNGEGTLIDAAFSYVKLSGRANANIDEALRHLSADGQQTAAELRRVGFFGLGLLLVGGVSSAAAYGWTGRRARSLTLDIEQARELDRMKSEFVALASHELRTPLTGIYGFSELLAAPDVSEDERRAWAEHIRSEAERLTTIVEDLLNVARIESGTLGVKAERVDFNDIVETVLRTFESRADMHSIEVSGDPLVAVRGDRNKLVEVLGNLVDNAVKYSPGGGRVRIACERTDELLRVHVSDEGLGIPDDEQGNIFGRFTRVANPDTENIRSTGLGLYVVRELVTRMGGTIAVRSVLGEGSTFTFSVPLYTDAYELEAAA